MENNNNFTNPMDPAPQGQSTNRKYVYIISAIVLIAILVFIFTKAKDNPGSNNGTAQEGTVKEAVVNLSAEARQVLESELSGLEEQIKGLKGDEFQEQRDKLYTQLAGVQYRLGKYQDGLNSLSKVNNDYKEKTPRVWAYYINIYREMGDKTRALQAAEKALSLDNQIPDYWLAVIEFGENRSNDEVKGIYEDALKKTDQDIEIVVSYAKFLEKIGDKPGAILMWQKAGQIDGTKKAEYDAEVTRLQQP